MNKKGTRGRGNKSTWGDYPNYCITGSGQNTVKLPGNLRIFSISETPVKDHQR